MKAFYIFSTERLPFFKNRTLSFNLFQCLHYINVYISPMSCYYLYIIYVCICYSYFQLFIFEFIYLCFYLLHPLFFFTYENLSQVSVVSYVSVVDVVRAAQMNSRDNFITEYSITGTISPKLLQGGRCFCLHHQLS